MEKDINDYFREITQNIYTQVEERLAKYGLVKGQAQLLLIIRDNEDCTQKDLANYFKVKYSSMSERLNKLENLGYIERVQDDENLKYKRTKRFLSFGSSLLFNFYFRQRNILRLS